MTSKNEVTISNKVRQGPTRTNIAGVTARNRLAIRGKEPGFVYRIINADQAGRLEELQERGYETVTHDMKVGDSRLDTVAKEGSPQTVALGGGTKGLVVRIKQEWFDEDQKIKEQRAADMEASIHPDAVEGGYGDVSKEQKRV